MSFPPITSLVPHRPPMLLIDEVRAYAPGNITCVAVVRGPSLFVDDGHAPAALALEYMAQCVSAYAGLRASSKGESIGVGYLVGAREVAFELDSFAAGDELTIEAQHAFGDRELGHFTCRVLRGGQTVASATLNVYQPRPGTMADGAR